MVRSPCREKRGLKKGAWTSEEDQKLMAYIEQYGHGSWKDLPAKAGLQRCGKSCRLRWTNYLRPDIKRGEFNLQEEQTIIQLHALLGNKWSAIATHLPKRTDNEIKNYWNTHLKKRLEKMGIDPVTHKPKTHSFGSAAGTGNSKDAANLSHVAQWESARLEAEARLVRESKQLPSTSLLNKFSLIPPATKTATTTTTTTTATTVVRPKCLDVLKAWQGMVSGMFFKSCSGENLESPTSTLNFPENGLKQENPLIFPDQIQVKETAGIQEMNNSDAWDMDSFMAVNEEINIVNELSDIVVDHQINQNTSSSGYNNSINLDQDNYWIDLMDTQAAAASVSMMF